MNSKHNPVRVFGQRSIASSFLHRSSDPSKDSNEDGNSKGSKKDSRVSFSDFLDRKLHTSSVPTKIVQGKPKPFLSPLGLRDVSGSIDGQIGINKRDGEKKSFLDQVVLEQFKQTSTEKVDCIGSCSVDVVGTSNIENVQEYFFAEDNVQEYFFAEDNVRKLRKRKNPPEGVDEKRTARNSLVILGDDANAKKRGRGVDEKRTARNSLVILGDDAKAKKRGRGMSSTSNKKPRSLYNHYANGCGWWDCDREGVDSEEVGFGEVWEGVGSTTFGGI